MTDTPTPSRDVTETGVVIAVHRSPTHSMRKDTQDRIRLLAGLGVEGDAHLGRTVQHRSRLATEGHLPNLRQVHLIHAELLDELRTIGFDVRAGRMGENITTRGVQLLDLPVGTRLLLGPSAVVELTGLRNPCAQLNDICPGLMAAVIQRDEDGKLIGKAGVMGVVLTDGDVAPHDPIRVELPPEPHRRLGRV